MQRQAFRRCASRALMCMVLVCLTFYREAFKTYLHVVSKSLSQIWTDSWNLYWRTPHPWIHYGLVRLVPGWWFLGGYTACPLAGKKQVYFPWVITDHKSIYCSGNLWAGTLIAQNIFQIFQKLNESYFPFCGSVICQWIFYFVNNSLCLVATLNIVLFSSDLYS